MSTRKLVLGQVVVHPNGEVEFEIDEAAWAEARESHPSINFPIPQPCEIIINPRPCDPPFRKWRPGND